MAVRPPFDNRTYLMEFRTVAYAGETKFGRTEHFFADVNTAVWALSKTLAVDIRKQAVKTAGNKPTC